jgi:hypothetical protein
MTTKKAGRYGFAATIVCGGAALNIFPANPASGSTVVFNDNFSGSSTVDSTNFTPTSNSTSYQVGSSKNATNSSITLNGGGGTLTGELNSATTSGFWEIQALFSADPTPFTLVNTGDKIEYDVTFTDTGGGLLSGGGSANIMMGLFNSSGTAPLGSGTLANAGLSTGSSNTTGGTQLWVGYAGQFEPSGSNSNQFFRPAQNGGSPTAADQELMGNNFGGGAFDNPAQGTKTLTASTISLTSGDVYTADMVITDLGGGEVAVTTTLYSGSSVNPLNSLGGTATTDYSGASLVTSFDGLGFGARNSGTSEDPIATISDISVVYSPVPEPASMGIISVAGIGLLSRRRRAL